MSKDQLRFVDLGNGHWLMGKPDAECEGVEVCGPWRKITTIPSETTLGKYLGVKPGVIRHKDHDYKRELHYANTGELLDRDAQTFEVPYDNQQTGEREVLRFRKNQPSHEKRAAIADAYARAGRPVSVADVDLIND